jgi:4-amino-4-deoxy-L-arabinose transferase-like glycosyltransferase
VDSAIADFFRVRKADYLNGHIYGMYPPGWPAILALFRGVGLEWWATIVLGATSVWLTLRIATRLHGATGGIAAVLLLATSQVFLIAHAGNMAHAAIICATLGAALCILAGADPAARHRRWLWLAAGALLGYAVAVRPLSGLALGASVALWMLLRVRRDAPRLVPTFMICLTLGGLVPGALLIAHNVIVYGDPLAVGYSVMGGAAYDLGFGQRGVTVLNEQLQRVPATSAFTPTDALAALLRRLVGMNTVFLPIGMLLPVVAAAGALGVRTRWSVVWLFASLPLVHLLYWYDGLRLYSELLPFLLIGVAGLIAGTREVRPQFARALLGTLIVASLIMSLPWRPAAGGGGSRYWSNTTYGGGLPPRSGTMNATDSLIRAHGRVLFFVRDDSRYDNFIGGLYWYNGTGFDGPAITARDLGARNAELLRRFPDRVPFLIRDRGPDVRGTIEPLSTR